MKLIFLTNRVTPSPPPPVAPTVTSMAYTDTGLNPGFVVNFSVGILGHTGLSFFDGDDGIAVTYVSGDGTNSLYFTADDAPPPYAGDSLTADYTPGDITDGVTVLAPFTDAVVTNNAVTLPPSPFRLFRAMRYDGDMATLNLTDFYRGYQSESVFSATPVALSSPLLMQYPGYSVSNLLDFSKGF